MQVALLALRSSDSPYPPVRGSWDYGLNKVWAMCCTELQRYVAGFQDVLFGVTVLLMSQSQQAAGVGRAQREQESCVHTPQDYTSWQLSSLC